MAYQEVKVMAQSTFSISRLMCTMLGLFALLLSCQLYASAQTTEATKPDESVATAKAISAGEPAGNQSVVTPVYSAYRGIKIGMTADEVRNTVDHLKEKGDIQDFFVFSDAETAQVFYDKQHRVMAVSIDYLGKDSGAPMPAQVLGETIQAKPDGSMYALTRYPDAGYWVSYNRTPGDNATVTITMQKM
jgi:hypothetical protein